MKRFAKLLTVTCVAALALAAVSAASASAVPLFTASATGELTGVQTNPQVFTPVEAIPGEVVTCKKAHTTGTIISTAAETQEVTVEYSECTAFGGFPATVTAATYDLHANGEVDVTNTIEISVSALKCKTIVGPQNGLKSVTYANEGGKIKESSAVKGIVSKGEGLCPGGTTGTYTGPNLVERVGGGTVSWDA